MLVFIKKEVAYNVYTEIRTINVKTTLKDHRTIKRRTNHRKVTTCQRIVAIFAIVAAMFSGVLIGTNQMTSAADIDDSSATVIVAERPDVSHNPRRIRVVPMDVPVEEAVVPEVTEPTVIADPEVAKIYDVNMPAELQQHMYTLTEQYPHLTVELLLSQVWRESTYRNIKSNPNGNGTVDHGYAQINTCNLKWVAASAGVTDIMDPYQNLNAQAFILNDLITKYHPENWHILLMMYNLGPGGAQSKFNDGIYSIQYSRDIVEYAQNTFDVTDITFSY